MTDRAGSQGAAATAAAPAPGLDGPHDADEAPAPGASRSRRATVRRALAVGLALLVVLAAAAVADVWAAWRQVERFAVATPPEHEGTTFLLVGVDRRPDDPTAATAPRARADVVVVVHRPEDGPARAVTVPRDLLVTLPGGERNRLTIAWDRGPQVLVDVLCDQLGVAVDHAVAVDMAGFARLVDAVGGIDVEVPRALRDGWTGIDVPAGRVHLDGPEALAYVRSRQALVLQGGAWVAEPEPEMGRRTRATAGLVALADELTGLGRDPVGLHRVLWAAADVVQADTGLGPGQAAALASTLRSVTGTRKGLVHLPASVPGSSAPVPVAGLGPGADVVLRQVGAGPGRCTVPADRGAG